MTSSHTSNFDWGFFTKLLLWKERPKVWQWLNNTYYFLHFYRLFPVNCLYTVYTRFYLSIVTLQCSQISNRSQQPHKGKTRHKNCAELRKVDMNICRKVHDAPDWYSSTWKKKKNCKHLSTWKALNSFKQLLKIPEWWDLRQIHG